MIQYRSSSNHSLLSAEQAALEGSYNKEYLVDGAVKKIEEYLWSDIVSISYYKDVNEQDDQIVDVYTAIASLKAVYIRTRETYGGYTVEAENSYFKNERTGDLELQPFIVKWLYDVNNMNVAIESIKTDLPDTDPDHWRIKKFYYFDATSPGTEEHYFISMFEEDAFICLYYVAGVGMKYDGQDDDEFNLQDSLVWMTQLGLTQELQYWYTNTVFLPPIS